MSIHCMKTTELELGPNALVKAVRTGASDWRDYLIWTPAHVRCGNHFDLYIYFLDADNYYRARFDYVNRTATIQECEAGVITDLVSGDMGLYLNASSFLTFAAVVDPRTRVPAVFYDDCSSFDFDDQYEIITGSPSYSSGKLVLAPVDEVQALQDIVGPCLGYPDTLLDDCRCTSAEVPATNLFDMADYIVSFVLGSASGSGTFTVKLRWNYDDGSGYRVKFDFDSDQVDIWRVNPGGGSLNIGSAALSLDTTPDVTLWIRVEGDTVSVYQGVAGTPSLIVSGTQASNATGNFGFRSEYDTPSGDFTVDDILCVPINAELFSVPWLLNWRSNDWLRDRDGADGALDDLSIELDRECRNILRATVDGEEISAYSSTFQKGTAAIGAGSLTTAYCPVLSIAPIITTCRDGLMV